MHFASKKTIYQFRTFSFCQKRIHTLRIYTDFGCFKCRLHELITHKKSGWYIVWVHGINGWLLLKWTPSETKKKHQLITVYRSFLWIYILSLSLFLCSMFMLYSQVFDFICFITNEKHCSYFNFNCIACVNNLDQSEKNVVVLRLCAAIKRLEWSGKKK